MTAETMRAFSSGDAIECQPLQQGPYHVSIVRRMRPSCTKNCTVRVTGKGIYVVEGVTLDQIPIDSIFQRIVLFGSRAEALGIEPFARFLIAISSNF